MCCRDCSCRRLGIVIFRSLCTSCYTIRRLMNRRLMDRPFRAILDRWPDILQNNRTFRYTDIWREEVSFLHIIRSILISHLEFRPFLFWIFPPQGLNHGMSWGIHRGQALYNFISSVICTGQIYWNSFCWYPPIMIVGLLLLMSILQSSKFWFTFHHKLLKNTAQRNYKASQCPIR